MPTITTGGVELYYTDRGHGDQTVVFSHSYLVDQRQFEDQIAALEQRYRVIAYDHRDHGRSSRVKTPYALEDLVDDAVAVIEQTGAGPCHFVGLSTGGFVGLRLALRHRSLLRSLVLMDTSAEAEPLVNRIRYQMMFLVLRLLGPRPVLGSAMRAMFGGTPRRDPTRANELAVWRERIAANDPAALVRFGNAIFRRDDVLARLRGVDLPVLVMVGEEDTSTPPPLARNIATAIPGARLEVVPASGHLSTVESPERINAVLVPFLDGVS
jgi:pimeloyl-ACP methyl ester carboxylesterase